MATQEDVVRVKGLEKLRRELYRRSLDQLKVFNPLDKERIVIWDRFVHRVPARKDTVFPRYIAKKFIRETIDHMINEDERKAVEKENNRRKKMGHQIMTPQENDQFVLRNGLKTDNRERRMKYMKLIYRGVSKEYGMDLPDALPLPKHDPRPTDTQLLEQLDEEMETLPSPDEFAEAEEKNPELVKKELIKEIGSKK